MSWFYERFTVQSEINGPIECSRNLGEWSVVAGENGQSNLYLNHMWENAFKRLPSDLKVRRILMLGLGTGGTLSVYAEYFPNASLTIIEIDPAMRDLMSRVGSAKKWQKIEVIVGDALEVVPKLQGAYDLVISDMFLGMDVAQAARQTTLIEHMLRLTERNGAILMNAYREADALDVLSKFSAEVARWKYHLNHVGLFRPHGAGVVGDTLPELYQHECTSEAYIQREYGSHPEKYTVLHAGRAIGVRRNTPIFQFDFYIGDAEPMPLPKNRARVTFWQPITRTTQAAGWKRFPIHGFRQLTGFALIPEIGPYHEGWSEHARRHRNKWLKQTTHEIVDADVETYRKAFKTCGKSKSIIHIYGSDLQLKDQNHPGMVRLRVARHTETKEIIAGFASLWIPEIKQTFHLTSFITKAGRETSVAFGLVDDVFRLSQERGCRVLEFDGFWTKGNPSSWKGFSNFKAQFGTYFVRWPRLFVRFDKPSV